MKPTLCRHCGCAPKITATKIIPVHRLDCPESLRALAKIRAAEGKVKV